MTSLCFPRVATTILRSWTYRARTMSTGRCCSSTRNPVGSDRVATYELLGVDGRYLSSVVRKGPGGKPVERIDFYLAGKDGP